MLNMIHSYNQKKYTFQLGDPNSPSEGYVEWFGTPVYINDGINICIAGVEVLLNIGDDDIALIDVVTGKINMYKDTDLFSAENLCHSKYPKKAHVMNIETYSQLYRAFRESTGQEIGE